MSDRELYPEVILLSIALIEVDESVSRIMISWPNDREIDNGGLAVAPRLSVAL